MSRWPVIALSFKDAEGLTFESAAANLVSIVFSELDRFSFLADSNRLTFGTRHRIRQLLAIESLPHEQSLQLLRKSLAFLIDAVRQSFGRDVIVLIDEYDVPLINAREHGFYREMLDVLRGMFQLALKDNPKLKKCVLSGCNRIVKESIFTGLNNFVCHTVSSKVNCRAFGFTQAEVDKILSDFCLGEYRDEIRRHYDGYRFGDAEIYCPWDVVNFCNIATQTKGTAECENFWLNTSHNAIITEFLEYADEAHLGIIRSLVNGESVAANINEDVSFDEISARHSPENMLGLLYSAGYLTSVGRTNDNVPILKIPNAEIQECFERKIEFYVRRSTYSSNNGRDLLRSFGNFDRINAIRILNSVLNRYASIRDSGYESFYHGFVLGLIT